MEDWRPEYDKLKNAIARLPTVGAGIIMAYNAIKQKLRDWEAKPSGPTAEEVREGREVIEATIDELAAAILVNTPAEKTDPLTVPAAVQGQPGTTYPDGVERPPFPTDKFPRDVDMSAPQPSPGIKPNKPANDNNSEPLGTKPSDR